MTCQASCRTLGKQEKAYDQSVFEKDQACTSWKENNMKLTLKKLSLAVDFQKGVITSLCIGDRERLTAKTPIFQICLRKKDGSTVTVTPDDARACTENEDGALYTDFSPLKLSVSITLKEENGEAAFRIAVTPPSDFFVEWVDFPPVTVPALADNNKNGDGGRILFPFNEGVLISDIERRQISDFFYTEPQYPSQGSFAVFPNMVFAQMLAYLFEDAGLYIGAHDRKRGVKDINFYQTDGGVTLRFRLFCGTDFGETFAPDYPIVFAVTEAKWEAAAERYRVWFEGNLPENVKKIAENEALPEWYGDSPLIVSYPVRGVHDMDEMKPNSLFPYTNALPLLDEIKKAVDSRLLVLLMHWEGTAPWAPPFVWPPYGGEENFHEFLQKLHEKGDLLGVYCSGFGYTIQSNLIAEYNKEAEYAAREYEKGMCAGPDGKVSISKICTGQRSGYDICPASEVGKKLLEEAYAPLLESDIDYVQILDQNHGGGQYFCYSREHGHAPGPGTWMTGNMQSMLSDWNRIAGKTLLGCESAAAEPFIGNLLFSDNRFELNYQIGVPVPLYAYMYHEYIRNFMGNQVCCVMDNAADTLRYRLAYSFCAGDSLTLVLTPQGEFMSHWGLKDFSHLPSRELALRLIRNLTEFYKKDVKKFLHNGRMIASPEVKCDSVKIGICYPEDVFESVSVLYSAWEAADGSRALILVNPDVREASCTVSGKTVTVPPLSGIAIDL